MIRMSEKRGQSGPFSFGKEGNLITSLEEIPELGEGENRVADRQGRFPKQGVALTTAKKLWNLSRIVTADLTY